MMMSPGTYGEEHKDDTCQQLIEERDKLIQEIRRLEKIVFDPEREDESWMVKPGPDVEYQMYLEYLAELCKRLGEKYNRDFEWDDFEDEPEEIEKGEN